MKRQLLFLLLVALSVGNVSGSEPKRESSFRRLQTGFSNPPAEFRTAPLWVWNTDVTEQDIDRMLTELKEQGFGGALVHPRPGLVTEYLSDEWFHLWRYALEKGRQLGLSINIYDENSYPSGFAGGHVTRQMPESYNQGQALIGQRTSSAPAPGDCYLCLLRQGDSFTDITSQLAEFQGRQADYYVYRLGCYGASSWTAGGPYVDLMAKGVTEKFIDITMGAYEKALGKDFGQSVNITFSDEPNIASPDSRHCRWTPDLFSTFQQLWGYDLRPLWPLLGEEVGDWQRVRHDYNATLLHLFIERWSKPWHDYAERKHLRWTGHYWEHNWPDLSQGPDNMAMYAWHQIPGIDMLFNQFDDRSCQAQFGNVRSVKELRSVANQLGQTRTLSETYGGGGWDERFVDFKRLGDWEFALGVNFMNQHLCHMTITGSRKYDYPPVFTSVSPWWQDYGLLNDYFARLSLVLSQGEQLNDWLIIEPTTSLWLHYSQVSGGAPLWDIANAFQRFITRLEKEQVEYDLGSENIIGRHGRVSDRAFCVGQRAYHTVVLPPGTVNLEASTVRLLRQFVQGGGRVIAFSSPSRISGVADGSFASELASAPSVCRMDSALQAVQLFQSESPVSIKTNSHDLYHHRRTYRDGQLLFLVNSSLEHEAAVNISLPGKHLYELDALSGSIVRSSQQPASLQLRLAPAGSALLFASATDVFPHAASAQPEAALTTELVPTGPLRIEPTHPNALNLDFCDLTIGSHTERNLYTQEASRRLWRHYGSLNPWETAVQFGRETLERDTFPAEDIRIDYPFFVEPGTELASIQAIIERPDIFSVELNGKAIAQWQPGSPLDARTGTFALGTHLRHGANHLTLRLARMHILAEIAPVILQGQFRLRPALRGFSLAPARPLTAGSWRSQGWSQYAWGMDYTLPYRLSDTDGPVRVRLAPWQGTVAEVYVNGEKAAVIIHHEQPDISAHLRQGDNTITVRIIGSLKNLYGPHYSSARGIMSPWMWNGVEQQRSGDEYDLMDYGMDAPFTLMR